MLTIDYLSIPLALKDCLVKCEMIKDSYLNTSDHYAVNAILNIQCLPGSRNTYRVDGRIKWAMPQTVPKYQDLILETLTELYYRSSTQLATPES